MSSTNRPKRTDELDDYETPRWATASLLAELPSERWLRVLEPSCGNGVGILDVLAAHSRRRALDWKLTGVELRPQPKTVQAKIAAYGALVGGDFLEHYPHLPYDLVVANPPFNRALEFAQHAIQVLQPGGWAFFLLRNSFPRGQERYEWVATNMPDDLGLVVRPNFCGEGPSGRQRCIGCREELPEKGKRVCPRGTKEGQTCGSGSDSCDYSWFRFYNLPGRTSGLTRLLRPVDLELRKRMQADADVAAEWAGMPPEPARQFCATPNCPNERMLGSQAGLCVQCRSRLGVSDDDPLETVDGERCRECGAYQYHEAGCRGEPANPDRFAAGRA